MMYFRKLIFVLAIVLIATACTKQSRNDVPEKVDSDAKWVQELVEKNPLKDSINITSVYFRFDTIINDFEVNGIFYPSYFPEYGWDAHENGVYLYFHSLNTGKEYCYTTWDNTCGCFSSYFMSINITNIVCDKPFDGFKNGDAYIFRYNTTIDSHRDRYLGMNAQVKIQTSYQCLFAHPDGDVLVHALLEGNAEGGVAMVAALLGQLLGDNGLMGSGKLAVAGHEVTDAKVVDVCIVACTLTGEILAEIVAVHADGFRELHQGQVWPQVELRVLAVLLQQ